MHVRALISFAAVVAALLSVPPALAQQPFAPYDGDIPFKCQLQNVGTGTDYPHPEADPFCVEFDKTNQNVTGFGIAEFTAQEPARVAAASSKCFYFQRDHWTGSVVQGSGPETWHWDGDYWYDRARGVGGVSVKNFRIGGQPQDARPYVPEGYRPYFDEGGGGVMMNMDTAPSPDCIDKVDTPEERDRIYANRSFQPDCIDPGGRLRGKRVGRVKLGMQRDRVRTRLGPPQDHRGRVDLWCLVGKGELRVAYRRNGKTDAILSSGRGHSIQGVSRGDRVRRARKRLDVADSVRLFGQRLLFLEREPAAWVGLRHRRVRWLTIFGDGTLTDVTLKRLFRDVR